MPVLKKKDLQGIIGAKTKRKMFDWIESNGIRYLKDVQCWPIVDADALYSKLGSSPIKHAKRTKALKTQAILDNAV